MQTRCSLEPCRSCRIWHCPDHPPARCASSPPKGQPDAMESPSDQ